MTGLTLIVLTFSLALVLVNFLVRAGALALELKWMRSPRITWRRLAAEAVITMLLSAVYLWASSHLEAAGQPPVVEWGGLLAFVIVQVLVLSKLFQIRYRRALFVWILLMVFNSAVSLAMAICVRTYLAEAFRITSSAMSPTLLGEHLLGTCPQCGGTTIVPPSAFEFEGNPSPFADDSAPMICVDHFHLAKADTESRTLHGPDRMLVLKRLAPKRWDLVVFVPPDREDDPQVYVMRIVGMPGETITIRDGEVFVGESAAQRPPALSEIRYSREEIDSQRSMPGDPSSPAVLGPDEYFVLGDFSPRSRDSRYWSPSDSGRPSYALPAANIRGIATHIYWPPGRWRAFR
jgi:signal peptidase I